MQVFYIVLMSFGYITYFCTVYQYGDFLSGINNIPFILLFFNLIFFFASSYVDPGIVHKNNVMKLRKDFVYDGNMYRQNEDCPTCEITKLARSKHCSVCDHCVARFDHHCSWVNNCIGGRNYKYFVLFISTLVMITLSASLIVVMFFVHITKKLQLFNQMFTDDTGTVYEATTFVLISFFTGEYPWTSFLLFYLTFLFIALAIFFMFHLFLIFSNGTTNEVFKRFKLRSQYDQILNNESASVVLKHRLSYFASYSSLVFSFYSQGLLKNIVEALFYDF